MNAANELRRTLRVLRKMWPASEAKQLAHFEQAIDFADERWREPLPAQEPAALAVNFAQGKPQGAEGGK